MAKVELKNIQKQYGRKTIIHGMDLAIAKGEFIVVVGPSGCGKSTLLRMIAGLEDISQGELMIDDKKVNRLPPKARNIAMVFQNYALYPHMSVYNNMAYGLKMRKFSKAEIDKRVRDAADILHISDYLANKPHELSGGQRQRVAMGRAIVRRPAVYLFDEPLSNLDAKLRSYMRLEIKRLHKTLNITSIYVTHDQMEAMTLADRLVVINEGRVEQMGTPLAIYQQPETQFVASFIGSPAMNFLDARVSAGGDALVIDDDLSIPLPIAVASHYHNQAIVLGIRPESLSEAPTKEKAAFALTIDVVDALGSDTLVHGFIGAKQQAFTARLKNRWQQQESKQVALSLAPESLHLFDAKSKKRIH